jgi:hypothetical protein
MKTKKSFIVFGVLLFSIISFLSNAFAAGLYDDFSGTYIDKNKWREGEFVREIKDGKLVLKQATPSPNAITAYSYVDTSNNLNFKNPDSVNSIQADVTIVGSAITNSANTRTRLAGRWFNDGSGTPGTDMTGDIFAEIGLRADSDRLFARWAVARYTDAGGGSETIKWGDFDTPINTGVTYTLFIGYDSATNQFTFRIGSEEITWGALNNPPVPPRVRTANSPWKGLTNRVQADNPYSSAYVSATFDNVYKNGDSYDDFSTSPIATARWTTYELVREVSEGKLRSKVRTGTAYTSNVNNRLEFVDFNTNNLIQAKVKPLAYENSQGRDVQARIGGFYYNDGTPGGGYLGLVGASVWIGGTGTSPAAGWTVWTYTDIAGNTPEVLAQGTFATPITLGNTYTLSLRWNEGQLTFKCDSEEAPYTPAVTIKPPNMSWKEIGSRILNPAGKEATIEAEFDDVMNEKDYIPLEGLSSENMGLAAWGQGHDVPPCISNAALHAYYYGATRDYVTGTPGANGLRGTGTIYGFTNFAAALSAGGYTVNDISIKFGKISLGNDTPGIDWDVYGDKEFRYLYLESDNDKLTISIAGVPILEQNPFKLTIKSDYNDPAKTADDIISGYTSYFIPTDITDAGTPPAIRNIASAFLQDVSGRGARVEISSLTTSGDFTYDAEAGIYLEVQNAKLALDPDGVTSIFGTKVSPAFRNEDLTITGMLFSDSYLDAGETKQDVLNGINNDLFIPYSSLRTNVSNLSYVLYGDKADVSWSWILTGKDGSDNTILIEKKGIKNVFRKENGNWVFYGNQEKYEMEAGSVHQGESYYAQFYVDDPAHTINSVTVTGTGIAGTLNLDHFDGSWGSFGSVNYGANPPSNAFYTITINEKSGGMLTYDRIIDGGVTGFATNLTPSGSVSGNITFTFTGSPRDGVRYDVTVFDADWNQIWDSDTDPQTIGFCPNSLLINYTGPQLASGTYNYNVISKIGDNSSQAVGQFTYSGPAVFSISGFVTSGGNPLSGVTMSGLPGNPLTNASGVYSGTVASGWSGVVTPQKAGYSFTPSSTPYTNVTSNQTQNYTAVLQTFTVTSSDTPSEDLNSEGFEGGAFSPLSKDYTLKNNGTASINWTATKTKGWVKLSKTKGTLAAGGSDKVTVSIVAKSANLLDAGINNDTVNFTNTSTHIGDAAKGVTLTVNCIVITLSPSDEKYTACSYYAPPTFIWTTNGGTLKKLELWFSTQSDFSSGVVKAKGSTSSSNLLISASTWKKVLLLPEPNGGTVYWKVVGTKANKNLVCSGVGSFVVEGPEAVGNPTISPTSKTTPPFPTLTWANNCNIKFKVWFANETDTSKKSFSFKRTNPNDNGGIFTQELSSSQWAAIGKLAGDVPEPTIYWYVESWDILKRYTKTDTTSFTLNP